MASKPEDTGVKRVARKRAPAPVKTSTLRRLTVPLDEAPVVDTHEDPVPAPAPAPVPIPTPAPAPVHTRAHAHAHAPAAVIKPTATHEPAVFRHEIHTEIPVVPILQRGTVRSTDVTAFLRQLIMLLEAGTPILRGLRALSERGERANTRALIADIAQFVESGNPLWQAFDRHPRYFDTVFVNLIKASEASGNLVPVLKRVTEHRENRDLMNKRVRGAMIYPVMLIFACFGVMLLLTNFVVPEFKDMFQKANLKIPPLTVQFLFWSDLFARYFYVPIVIVVVLFLLYRFWFVRSPVRRLWADRFKLRIPITGPIAHKNALVEFSQTLAMLLRSGVSMMAALDLTRNAIHNRAVAQTLQTMRDSVEQGGGLEAPMRASRAVIPPIFTDMIVTGEESGRIDEICSQLGAIYEEEVKIAVATLGETLQPVFTVFIGVMVIILFVSLFLPLVTMIQQISSAST